MNSIVMEMCCDFFAVRTKCLNIIQTSFQEEERALPGNLHRRKCILCFPPLNELSLADAALSVCLSFGFRGLIWSTFSLSTTKRPVSMPLSPRDLSNWMSLRDYNVFLGRKHSVTVYTRCIRSWLIAVMYALNDKNPAHYIDRT